MSLRLSLVVLALASGVPAAAVEPEPVLVLPLTQEDLRLFATQHAQTYKACLREAFGTQPSRLRVRLRVDATPSLHPPQRGDGTPDPWTRTIDVRLTPEAPARALACIKKPTEYLFRNVSLAYLAPPRPIEATVTWEHLNARTEAQTQRLRQAEATVAERLARRTGSLQRCLRAEHPARVQFTLHFTSLGNGDINLDGVQSKAPPRDVVPCLAAALGVHSGRVGEADAEAFTLPLTLLRPDDAPPYQRPEIPDEPQAP